MKQPTKAQIERAANAIKFMVPLNGYCGWTEKGLRQTKWPKHFAASERKIIRRIARTILETALSRQEPHDQLRRSRI